MFPLATATGWPFQLPNHTLTGTESVISSDTIDHDPPDPFVHEIAVVSGIVTFDPDELAEDCVENAVPPDVYPVPDSSVPEDEPELAVEVSFSFIADPPSDSAVPGTPAVPVGVIALRIFDDIAASIAV